MINISQESPQDLESIYNLNLKAFESDAEAKLVDKLRETIKPFISLVAKEHGIVLGHILFTPVWVGDSNVSAMGLGPMATVPERQGEGIGSVLIKKGFQECKKLSSSIDLNAVFVLGEPDYYRKFGFELASEKGCYYKSNKFTPYFFVIELIPNCLKGTSGEVKYHKFFDDV